MSDFNASYYAGMAMFGVAGTTRTIRMDKSTFNAVCQLLNDARKAGERDAAKTLVGVLNDWAEKA
jgi:hypothetical protein